MSGGIVTLGRRVPQGQLVTIGVPEGVDVATWWRQQVRLYGEPSPPTGTVPTAVLTELAFVLEAAGVCDLLADPARIGWASGQVVDTRRTVPPQIGQSLPATIFSARPTLPAGAAATWNPDAPGISDADKLRRLAFLANVSVLRSIVTAPVVPVERAGGEILTALVVGSVIVAGIAFDAYIDRLRTLDQLQVESAERVARARIAQAGQDALSRIAQQRATGTLPPPTPLETAVAGEQAQRARSEWGDFWQGAARAAQSGTKLLGVAALALLALNWKK